MCGKPHPTGSRTVLHSDRVCRADFRQQTGLFGRRSEADGNHLIPDTPTSSDAAGPLDIFGGFLRQPGRGVLVLSAYAYREGVSLVLASYQRPHHPVHAALNGRGPYIAVLVELPDYGNVRMIGNLLGDASAIAHLPVSGGENPRPNGASSLPGRAYIGMRRVTCWLRAGEGRPPSSSIIKDGCRPVPCKRWPSATAFGG
jgi:hypothetical protein